MNDKRRYTSGGWKRNSGYVVLGLLVGFYILAVVIHSCGKATGTGGIIETTASMRWERRPCVMLDDTLFLVTGSTKISVPDEAYIGDIITSVDGTELPDDNFVCNCDATGAKVYRLSDNSDRIYVKVEKRNVTLIFEKESAITFSQTDLSTTNTY